MVVYRNIKFPDDMIEDIIKLINENKELGYRSHSEFIIEAVRKRVIEMKQFLDKNK